MKGRCGGAGQPAWEALTAARFFFFSRQVGSSRPMTELQSAMTASEPDLLRVEEWYEEGQEELDRGHDIRCLSLRRCYVCRIL